MTQAASRNSVPMRQRIIAVATEMLAERGYEGTSLQRIADEVGLKASVSSTDGASSIRQLVRETAAVSLGRILGYRRVDNWLEGVG